MRPQTILATATLLAVGVLLGAAPIAAVAQDKNPDLRYSPAQLAESAIHRRAVEAVIWAMPSVNAELMFQAPVQAKGGLQPGRLLVAARRLEESDAHAEPRHHLSYAFLQHEGRGADGAGDSGGGERKLDHWEH